MIIDLAQFPAIHIAGVTFLRTDVVALNVIPIAMGTSRSQIVQN